MRGGGADLYQRTLVRCLPLIQQLLGARVWVTVEQSLRSLEQAFQGAEGVVHAGSLVAGVHHAVRASRIPTLSTVIRPLHRLHQFSKGIRVTVLQQIAGL